MVLGDLDNYMQKKETRPPTYTICQNKLKMDKRLKYKLRHHKSPRGKHRQENFSFPTQPYFHPYIFCGKGNKGKNKQMGLHQIKKLLRG